MGKSNKLRKHGKFQQTNLENLGKTQGKYGNIQQQMEKTWGKYVQTQQLKWEKGKMQ